MTLHDACRTLVLAIPLLACACMDSDQTPDAPRVTGDTPVDVASSIIRLKANLDPDRQVAFGHAVTTLTLVTPDKSDPRTIGYISPHFAHMVSGRNAEQIIELAARYRASIPSDHR